MLLPEGRLVLVFGDPFSQWSFSHIKGDLLSVDQSASQQLSDVRGCEMGKKVFLFIKARFQDCQQ